MGTRIDGTGWFSLNALAGMIQQRGVEAELYHSGGGCATLGIGKTVPRDGEERYEVIGGIGTMVTLTAGEGHVSEFGWSVDDGMDLGEGLDTWDVSWNDDDELVIGFTVEDIADAIVAYVIGKRREVFGN